jgi:hypothetical protein
VIDLIERWQRFIRVDAKRKAFERVRPLASTSVSRPTKCMFPEFENYDGVTRESKLVHLVLTTTPRRVYGKLTVEINRKSPLSVAQIRLIDGNLAFVCSF